MDLDRQVLAGVQHLDQKGKAVYRFANQSDRIAGTQLPQGMIPQGPSADPTGVYRMVRHEPHFADPLPLGKTRAEPMAQPLPAPRHGPKERLQYQRMPHRHVSALPLGFVGEGMDGTGRLGTRA